MANGDDKKSLTKMLRLDVSVHSFIIEQISGLPFKFPEIARSAILYSEKVFRADRSEVMAVWGDWQEDHRLSGEIIMKPWRCSSFFDEHFRNIASDLKFDQNQLTVSSVLHALPIFKDYPKKIAREYQTWLECQHNSRISAMKQLRLG